MRPMRVWVCMAVVATLVLLAAVESSAAAPAKGAPAAAAKPAAAKAAAAAAKPTAAGKKQRDASASTGSLKECTVKCQNGGFCYDGKCQCAFGFDGAACQLKKTCPIDAKTGAQCGGKKQGTCDATSQTCVCAPGFSGADCATKDKLCGGTNCSNHGSCAKGICFCDSGFTGAHCEKQAACLASKGATPCGGRGLCYNDVCRCYPGFTGEFCDQTEKVKTCPKNCSGRGVCQFGQCICQPAYTGADCSQFQPGSFCATSGGDCSGHGVCSGNKCLCEPGTSGTFCEKGGCKKCHPSRGVCLKDKCFCKPGFGGEDCSNALTCKNGCSMHGTCVNGKCKCEKYFSGESCEEAELGKGVCPYKCSGNGVCHEGKCLCIHGRKGSDCSEVVKTRCGSKNPQAIALSATQSAAQPSVDDTDCNGNGSCFRKLCVCKPGFYGKFCEKRRKCSKACLKNGVCNYGTCLCAPDFTGKDCQISTHRQQDLLFVSGHALDTFREKDFTCVEGDATKCSLHGVCRKNRCQCDEGFAGKACEQVLVTGVFSSRCPAHCSDHGFCQLGKCVCDLGYTGHACDKKLDMPCVNNCNGKGICEYGRCHCDSNYAGSACETKLKCAHDCSAMKQGVCVAGRCVCLNGYTGVDCTWPPIAAPVSAADANSTYQATTTDGLSKASRRSAKAGKKTRFASTDLDADDPMDDHSHAELGSRAADGSYVVPVHPAALGVMAFLIGVLVAYALNFAYQKREEHLRRQKAAKPLFSTR